LSIARAFIKECPIVIFDEATSNLDSISEKQIQKAFWELSSDKTTVIIAHRLSTIQKVDRILVFDHGEIMEEGTHSELIQKQKGLYRYLWELQSRGKVE
jgi:ATP-binding cassette, subfamily B, bacterial